MIKKIKSFTICSHLSSDIQIAIALIFSIKKFANLKNANFIAINILMNNLKFVENFIDFLELVLIKFSVDNDQFKKIQIYNNINHLYLIELLTFIKLKKSVILHINEISRHVESDTLLIDNFDAEITYKKKKFTIGKVNHEFFSAYYRLEMYKGKSKKRLDIIKSFNAGILLFFSRKDFNHKKYVKIKVHHWIKSFTYMNQVLLKLIFWNYYIPFFLNNHFHNLHKILFKNFHNPDILQFVSPFKQLRVLKISPKSQNRFGKWFEKLNKGEDLVNLKLLDGDI